MILIMCLISKDCDKKDFIRPTNNEIPVVATDGPLCTTIISISV